MKTYFKRLLSFNFLRHNAGVKVICLILGILSWFYVMDSRDPVVTNIFYNMPVEILGKEQIENQQLIIGTIENETIDVSVTGTWKKIMSLTEKDISLTATLVGSAKGPVSIPIEARVADSTIALELSEKIMRVDLDAIETELKDVRTVLNGTPPAGIEIGELLHEQTKVSVKGPSKILKTIAYVEAVGDIGNNLTSFTSFMQLTPKNDKGEVVTEVEVIEPFLEVEVPFIVSKRVPVELSYTVNFGDRYKLGDVTLDPEEIEIRGEKTLIDKITSIPTRDYVLASSTNVEVNLQLLLPAHVTSATEQVNASFEVNPVETRTFNFRPNQVTILNPSPDYDYTFTQSDMTIQIDVRDSREVLALLNPDDLKLTIDVSSQVPGLWTTPIKLTGLPTGSTATINPTAIPIEITVK